MSDECREIAKCVKQGRCILFLGAGCSRRSPVDSKYTYPAEKAPPDGKELSRALARMSEYPEDDQTNLQRVALHFESNKGRHELVKTITAITEAKGIVPSPALYMLAKLPFPIIITTNYDHLFDTALARADTRDGLPKRPILRVYDPLRAGEPETVPLDPSEEEPVLLKLHGDTHNPESIVVTEEDYLAFIEKMSDRDEHPIHRNIQARLSSWPVLFIGYSLKDYNLRLLFRTLKWKLDKSVIVRCFAVDPSPDALIVQVWGLGEKRLMTFIEMDLWDFVPSLYKEVIGVEYSGNKTCA